MRDTELLGEGETEGGQDREMQCVYGMVLFHCSSVIRNGAWHLGFSSLGQF